MNACVTLRAPNGNPFKCWISGNRAHIRNNGDVLSRECSQVELASARAAMEAGDVQTFGAIVIDGEG